MQGALAQGPGRTKSVAPPLLATVPVGSYSATISYSGDAATQAVTGGNDVVLSFAPVPEPASVLTAAATAAAAGVAGWWRRRRAG